MQKLISVIIPIYNVESYLRKCLDSVINQTYSNLEIILIDDGSPDNCGSICDEYAEKDSRIMVIHKANAGVGAARNDGLDMVTGDWITFVDSDDWIEPDYCEHFMQFAAKHQADMVFMGGAVLEYNGSVTVIRRSVLSEFVYTKAHNPEKWEILQAKVLSGKISDDHLSNQFPYGYVWNVFYNARFWKENNIKFNTEMSIYEDGLFNFMMIEKASSVGVFPYIGYHYRKTNVESSTHGYIPERINNILIYVQNLYFIKNITNMKLLDVAVAELILHEFFECLKTDYFHEENPKKKREIKKELLKIKQNFFIQHAIWQKKNHLLSKRIGMFKLCLRLPGVWSIRPFYKLSELLRRNKSLRYILSENRSLLYPFM